jgi:hypothetical protein
VRRVSRSTSAVLRVRSPDLVTVQREAAGQRRWSRDGDSNPGPAHYEQSNAERCAHRRYTLRQANRP